MENQEKFPFAYVPGYTENLSTCWERVLDQGQKAIYRNGESFALGENSQHFGYINKGIVASYFKGQVGRRDEIRSFTGPGCLLKESFCVCGYGDVISYHKAIGNVEMYIFNQETMLADSFYKNNFDLFKNIQFTLAAKSISFQLLATILKQKSAVQKLACFVYGMFLLNQQKKAFNPQLTQLQIGELLGISSFTVNRIVREWKEQEVISAWTKRTLKIIDPAKLARLRAIIL